MHMVKKWEHQSSSWSLKAASQHMIWPIPPSSIYHGISGATANDHTTHLEMDNFGSVALL